MKLVLSGCGRESSHSDSTQYSRKQKTNYFGGGESESRLTPVDSLGLASALSIISHAPLRSANSLALPSVYEAPDGSLCPHFTGVGTGRHFTDGDKGVYAVAGAGQGADLLHQPDSLSQGKCPQSFVSCPGL